MKPSSWSSGEAVEAKECAFALHSELAVRCVDLACAAVDQVEGGSGLEGMRLLMDRVEQRSALTKRAHHRAMITTPPSRKIEELESTLLKLEPDMKKCGAMSGRPLDVDLKVTVVIGSCVNELCGKLEMSSKDRLCRKHSKASGRHCKRTDPNGDRDASRDFAHYAPGFQSWGGRRDKCGGHVAGRCMRLGSCTGTIVMVEGAYSVGKGNGSLYGYGKSSCGKRDGKKSHEKGMPKVKGKGKGKT